VDPAALTFGFALAALLIGIAIYFGLQQRKTLALLRHDIEMPRADRVYLHRQVVRRLINSVLLVVLALLLIGGLFLQPSLQDLNPGEPVAEPGAKLPANARDSLNLLSAYWIGFLLVFLAMMVMAVLDLVSTARYGAQQRRQLEDDRRDALAAEVERLRRDRHGLNGGL
jgi:cell division protein FtsB